MLQFNLLLRKSQLVRERKKEKPFNVCYYKAHSLYIAFDPNIDIDISNTHYVQIHNEYKNLVDYMLGSFMEEMSITPEEFEIACMEGKNLSLMTKDEAGADGHSFSFHKGLFQQIWAANDIRTFVRLMKQRNLEIQIQGNFMKKIHCKKKNFIFSSHSRFPQTTCFFLIALDLIERRQTSLQDSTSGDGITTTTSMEGENEFKNNKDEDEKNVIEKAVEEEIEKSVEAESQLINDANEIQQHHDVDEGDIDDKFKRLNLFFEQEKARTNADVVSRQEYLRQQRDKILQIKKQARARQLYETSKDRPKSAVAAQKIIDGSTFQPDEASMQVVQVRKMLAKKLRDEVVNNAGVGMASES